MNIPELLKLEVSSTVENRIKQLLPLFSLVLNEDIERIFITNKIADHQNIYINLWVFSSSYVCEAKDFMFRSDIDIAKLNNVSYINLVSDNFDGTTVSTNTLLTLNVHFGTYSPTKMSLESFGENSANLLEIYNLFIKPKVLV